MVTKTCQWIEARICLEVEPAHSFVWPGRMHAKPAQCFRAVCGNRPAVSQTLVTGLACLELGQGYKFVKVTDLKSASATATQINCFRSERVDSSVLARWQAEVRYLRMWKCRLPRCSVMATGQDQETLARSSRKWLSSRIKNRQRHSRVSSNVPRPETVGH